MEEDDASALSQDPGVGEKKNDGSAGLDIFPNFIHHFVARKWGLGILLNQYMALFSFQVCCFTCLKCTLVEFDLYMLC